MLHYHKDLNQTSDLLHIVCTTFGSMKTQSRSRVVCTLFLVLCTMAVYGQTNLAASAAASADTFLVDHPASAAIDGDTADGTGWAASAMDTLNQNQTNIAPAATATASAYVTGHEGYYTPEKAIDGITGPWAGWAASATGDDLDQWLELTWPSAQSVNKVVLFTNPAGDVGTYTLRGYTLQYWDGTAYQNMDTVSGNTSEVVTSTFDAVTTMKIRVYCTEPDSAGSFYRISELEVFSNVHMEPHWLDLTWASEQIVSKVVLFTSSNADHALRGFDIQYWDGAVFQSAATVGGNTNAQVTSHLNSVSTSKIRILCTEPDVSSNWYRINEVEVYDDPLPAIDDSTWNLDFETIHYFFPSPPNHYRTVQYTLNQDLQQGAVDQLLDYGFGGIQTMTPFANYLQDENGWTQTIGDVDLALENDMKVWIHDERGYPSGAAGGLVVEGHPEFENRGVIRITQKGTGMVNISMELPAGIEFFRATLCFVVNNEPDYENATEVPITNHQITTTGLAGDWQVSAFGITILDENTQAQITIEDFGQTGHYPSLLNRDACARFVELTHQNYANHLGEIHKKVELFYTNEPNLMTTYFTSEGEYPYVAWENDLPNQFMAMHGYDLIPRLDALFGGYSSQSKMVRLHFHQTVGEVMARNFTGQISEWCHANGVKLGGHFLLEEYMIFHAICYGDFMKVIRNLDVPACDLPIARPSKTNWNFWMPKYISSASYLENKNAMVVGLIDPIIGFGKHDMSPDIPYMKRTLNMAFLCGINQVNSYIPYKEYVGEEKEEHIRLIDYIARICLMLRGAKNEARIAIYYPIEIYQANYIPSSLIAWNQIPLYSYLQKTLDRLAADILQNGLDFNYVTADAILNASIEGSAVKVGTHSYSSIVMPRVEVIPLDVLKKLEAIADAGIPVYWVDVLPSLGTKQSEQEEVQQIASTLVANNNPLPDLQLIRDKEFSIHVSSSDNKIFMSRFTRDGHRIYYVINDSDIEINITAESEQIDTVQVYNPVNGEIREVPLPLSEKIGGYESLFLVEEILTDSTVGVIEISSEVLETIQIYPNPASDNVTIKVPARLIGSRLEIFDISGRVMESQTISGELFTINISSYLTGMYFVGIMGETPFRKLIKN